MPQSSSIWIHSSLLCLSLFQCQTGFYEFFRPPIIKPSCFPTKSNLLMMSSTGQTVWLVRITTLPEILCWLDKHDSNARTRGQFKPRNAIKGTSSYHLRQFAEATLGSGSLRKVVKLPDGEDLNEWLAVNGQLGFAVDCMGPACKKDGLN